MESKSTSLYPYIYIPEVNLDTSHEGASMTYRPSCSRDAYRGASEMPTGRTVDANPETSSAGGSDILATTANPARLVF